MSDSVGDERGTLVHAGRALVGKILHVAIDGSGPLKGAAAVADETLASCHGDVERAVERVIRTHVRLAGASGFTTSLGGWVTLPASVPAGLGSFYILAARMTASIAHLRGYDVKTEHVRSAVLISLLGSAGQEMLKELGVQIGTLSLGAALKKVPGRIFIEINKKVGYRLVTKAGEKGVINMTKLVPLVGAPIGGTIDVIGMKTLAGYAKSAFPAEEVPIAVPTT